MNKVKRPGTYDLGYGRGNITVTAVRAHRNGIGGRGFYAARFVHEGTMYIGLVPYDANGEEVMVVDPTDLSNTMRGNDWYGDALRRACKSRSAEAHGWLPEGAS